MDGEGILEEVTDKQGSDRVKEAVILSGVDGSRSEAATESKEPLPVGAEMNRERRFHDAVECGENYLMRLR